ncbi:MAG TPA: ABC transporter substrate-binding protein [Kofleriaceae bacterium]|nr:ABC transporter substrate-binding protein [Kofleriaceae bacterium]
MKGTALAALAVLVLACDARPTPRLGQRDPGTLVVAQAAGVIGLDPARVTDSESLELGELLFEGLVGWKPGTTDIEPRLASAWQASADGRTWTFHLRDRVRFHDGTLLDANAVVFSFERVLDAKHPYYLAASNDVTYWRTLLKDVESVTAVEPLVVEIHTRRPYSPLLGELAIFPIVSPVAVREWGDAFSAHPVGTGPYMLERWDPGQDVVVRRFDRYWGPAPILDRIVFEVVVDARQRLVDLEAGTVDLATAILPDEQPFVELHPDLVLHHTPANDVAYLAFNTTHPPFDDVRVRRAANLAINKEPIVKLGFQGRAIAASTPLPPTMWGYHVPAVRYAYDPAAARALIAEATADGAFDGKRVFKLYAPSTPRPYLPQPERVARFLQAGLDQIGIHTELVLEPYAEARQSVARGEHDLALFGWIGDTGDPDNFLYVLFHSDNAQLGDAQNIAFYRDPEVDKLLADAQGIADEPTRAGLYAAVQDKLAVDAPWVPIAHSELVVAGRAEITHVVLSPVGHPVYSQIRREEPR